MKRYAIFFPQFYRIDINDLAWGHGFTDWTLVSAANAFTYWERRSPSCGFYDLSRDHDIHARFEFASNAGIDGFAIYHYRFDDGPELQAVEQYLQRERPPGDFSYFYIWANENWTTRWIGNKVRMLKELSRRPDRRAVADHVDYLAPFMRSTFYTTVGDRPLFVVYRPDHFSEPEVTLALYRDEFQRVGLNPLVGFCVKNVADMLYTSHFDFCYMFEPRLFFNSHGVRRNPVALQTYRMLTKMLSQRTVEAISEAVTRILNKHSGSHSFADFLQYFASDARRDLVLASRCPVQEIVTCGWNNAPRYRNRRTKLDVPSVDQFSVMMNLIEDSPASGSEVPLLCNAWNEWAEGAAIEPCSYLGDTLLRSYLEGKRLVHECRYRIQL